MSVFLIDYENLHTSAFSGLEELSEEDRVLIFYTNNSDNLTFSLMQRLNSAKARIEYLKVNCGGKNSLDFQLCSYLGYLLGVAHDTRFCIVSRDKGFSTVLNFWAERPKNGNAVFCGPSIRAGIGKKHSEAEQTLSEQTSSEQASSEQTTSEQASSEQTTSEQTLSEQASPEQTTSEQASPEQAQPEQASPEQTTSEQALPEQPAGKPKRKYNRRAPYKRKPKAPEAEQTA